MSAFSVAASALSTTPGGATITLTATLNGITGTPTWSLDGPGSLSASSGTSVVYTPPASGAISANATAIVSASLTNQTTQTVSLAVVFSAAAVGQTWNTVAVQSTANLVGVDYLGGDYVAIDDAGTALESSDAANWIAVSPLTSSVSTDHLKGYAISHNGSNFVAAGSTSSSPYTTVTGAVATSTDGQTWTMRSLPSGATAIHGLIDGTILVGLGETGHLYASSDNGVTWTALTPLATAHIGTMNAGAFGATKYVAVGNSGFVGASANGTLWQSGQLPNVGNLNGAAWTGTRFVAVGDSGTIITSSDGTNWAPQTSAISGTLRSVSVSSAGTVVAVGDGGIETSPDGLTWTARNASGVAPLAGVTFGNNEFVAVGASGVIKSSNN